MNHIRKTQAKLSDKWGDYGYSTFCDKKVEYASTGPARNEINCPTCVHGFLKKKEDELEKLKKIWGDYGLDGHKQADKVTQSHKVIKRQRGTKRYTQSQSVAL